MQVENVFKEKVEKVRKGEAQDHLKANTNYEIRKGFYVEELCIPTLHLKKEKLKLYSERTQCI